MSCIFCAGTVDDKRVEHILPESLGGKGWACLPPGLVCSSCNQYFGSNVEGAALQSFPFLPFRLLLGIPTKRNRAPEMDSMLGRMRASFVPGTFGLDPITPEIEESIVSGQVTQVRILAEVTAPLAVCRLLLKMGLEVVAADSPDYARSSRFDAARSFARAPIRGRGWWFLIYTDHEKLFKRMQGGVSAVDWATGVALEVVETEGVESFHLRLLDMDLITPLDEAVIPPDMRSLPEPDYRLIHAKCVPGAA